MRHPECDPLRRLHERREFGRQAFRPLNVTRVLRRLELAAAREARELAVDGGAASHRRVAFAERHHPSRRASVARRGAIGGGVQMQLRADHVKAEPQVALQRLLGWQRVAAVRREARLSWPLDCRSTRPASARAAVPSPAGSRQNSAPTPARAAAGRVS